MQVTIDKGSLLQFTLVSRSQSVIDTNIKMDTKKPITWKLESKATDSGGFSALKGKHK